MNAKELRKLLAAKGCTFENHKGGSGTSVRRGGKTTQLPMHGGGKELGKGLVAKILKDLELSDAWLCIDIEPDDNDTFS